MFDVTPGRTCGASNVHLFAKYFCASDYLVVINFIWYRSPSALPPLSREREKERETHCYFSQLLFSNLLLIISRFIKLRVRVRVYMCVCVHDKNYNVLNFTREVTIALTANKSRFPIRSCRLDTICSSVKYEKPWIEASIRLFAMHFAPIIVVAIYYLLSLYVIVFVTSSC